MLLSLLHEGQLSACFGFPLGLVSSLPLGLVSSLLSVCFGFPLGLVSSLPLGLFCFSLSAWSPACSQPALASL